MSTQIPYDWKYCATCAYWGGTRTADRFIKRVTVTDTTAKGKCLCMKCGWRNTDRQASATCSDYEKWQVLKQ